MKKTVEEVQQENLVYFMEHGPGLSTGYGTYVIYKNSEHKMVFLGGLGEMGVGQMWVSNDDGYCKNKPGYDEAPEKSYDPSKGNFQ